jgi:hypothetical protein
MTRRFAFFRKPNSLPLTFAGATLPSATLGAAYSQSIASYVAGGVPAYAFTELSDAGDGGFSVSSSGVISGSPIIPAVYTDQSGNYLTDNSGNLYTS